MKSFTSFKQLDGMDCGPTCLRMIAKHYGKNYSSAFIRNHCNISKGGTSLLGISDSAENIGFKTAGIRIDIEKFNTKIPLPCIVHWNKNHFVVVYHISQRKAIFKKDQPMIYIADPAAGKMKYTHSEFKRRWISTIHNGYENGHCLVLEPTPKFYEQEDQTVVNKSLLNLAKYLRPHKKLMTQLVLSFVTSSFLQMLFPLISQSFIDNGINYKNLNLLKLLLIGQLLLLFGQTSVTYIQSWITLHLTTRMDISLISDFLARLMQMPLSFFDTKLAGDIMQRIGDNNRIQSFLTSTSVSVFFALGNFLVFSCVMVYYSPSIFLIFLAGSTLYFLWAGYFLKYRRELDNRNFSQGVGYQNTMIEIVNGMHEIKLNNCENRKRWEWERLQVELFKIRTKGLVIGQYQQGGAFLINNAKNFTINYLTARAVIEGNLTLGVLFSIQYIIGQLNSPIEQFITFIRSLQDAKISLERLDEIKNENQENRNDEFAIHELAGRMDIKITNLTFFYEGPSMPPVLQNINLFIPENKITAIVGVSGSGKTTLLKMLLGFYKPNEGIIAVGENQLDKIDCKVWRQSTGTVMQDGFIFSDTIENNIALSDDSIDENKLKHAVNMANIKDFIESLALKYKTRIGNSGYGISHGQKQRILIARAIYKNPKFIFLDEATNALDSNNEKIIMDNLNNFFKGRTVVVVAHRLSTVKNADNIVVLNKGKIVEQGTHTALTKLRGAYFNLIKDQLELSS